jgi:hypothetical protein
MAVPLRISAGYRVSVRSLGSVVLFTAERTYAAALRNWSREEAKRLAILVAWSRYSEDEAVRELAAHLRMQAEKSGITGVNCKKLAVSMLDDELQVMEVRHDAVLQRMIGAAEQEFRINRRADLQAAMAAADIAEAENVPPDLIDSAFRIARWRARKGA